MITKKYQIKEVKELHNHAGSKAIEDVCDFSSEIGYTPLYVRQRTEDRNKLNLIQNQIGFVFDWFKAFLMVEKNSVILLQNPFKRKHLLRFTFLRLMKKIKKCKIISVIHDVEILRETYFRDFSKTEFEFMLENSDYFIVHNDIMKEYFVSTLNINPERLVSLEIFDYGFNSQKPTADFESADIVVAGNLEKKKSVYVYKLKDLKDGLKINLYGPNYEDDNENSNVKYIGSFPPNEVPNVLNGKFGLIWDGDSLDCCAGQTGNYLRYNNPHKTSLYITAGIPIVIWKEAAMARFVERENVGITVASLSEIKKTIDSLSDKEYEIMKNNAVEISKKLTNGYYLKTALAECENRICKGK